MTAKYSRQVLRVAVTVGLGLSLALEAGSMQSMLSKIPFFRNWSAKNRVESLIITGNYARSRLLAELVQKRTKQAILLISPTAQDSVELFFLPSGPDAVAIGEERYAEFVGFLRPKRLIFLGDSSYVPQKYVDALRHRFPTMLVTSQDWQNNARTLATVFGKRKLPTEYAACLLQLGERLPNAEDRRAAAAPAPGGIAEPLVLPRSVTPGE